MELTVNQFNLVANVFSTMIGALGLATAFFFLQRNEVTSRYRVVLTLLGLVAMMGTYNYFRLYESWQAAFVVGNGAVQATAHAFDDVMRYPDWLVTLPLLLVAIVLTLDMPDRQARLRNNVLRMLAVEMVVLAYPGQIAAAPEDRWLWWGVSMVPFALIVFQLFVSLGKSLNEQSDDTRRLVGFARTVAVLALAFDRVAYLVPLAGLDNGPTVLVGTQVGFAIADFALKVVCGAFLYTAVFKRMQTAESAPQMPKPIRTMKVV